MANHFFTRCQRILPPIQPSKYKRLHHKCLGDPLSNCGNPAFSETMLHFVVGSERVRRSALSLEHKPLHDKGLYDPLAADGGLILAESTCQLVAGGDRLVRATESLKYQPFVQEGKSDPDESSRSFALSKRPTNVDCPTDRGHFGQSSRRRSEHRRGMGELPVGVPDLAGPGGKFGGRCANAEATGSGSNPLAGFFPKDGFAPRFEVRTTGGEESWRMSVSLAEQFAARGRHHHLGIIKMFLPIGFKGSPTSFSRNP